MQAVIGQWKHVEHFCHVQEKILFLVVNTKIDVVVVVVLMLYYGRLVSGLIK